MIAEATQSIRSGASFATDPVSAASELYEALHQEDLALVLFFCAPDYPLDALGDALRSRFGPVPLVGCTTAGEIGPAGYRTGSISGVSFSSTAFTIAMKRVDSVRESPLVEGTGLGSALIQELRDAGLAPNGTNTFGFLLVDGLSNQEESLVNAIYSGLGDIQLIGGSAGDNVRFGTTYLYHDGAFRTDCAVFMLFHTQTPFAIFKTEHFVRTDEKMVVTEADPSRRMVTEINGEPAAREYARIMGVGVEHLEPTIFATHPVVVRMGGANYVRSIMRVNPDESLTFACAIDEGIVLTVAEHVDLLENLETAFADIRRQIGPPALILGCDCLFRAIEMDQTGIREAVGNLLQENNVVGFSTYGEQFNAMHVNQTFTGVAIGTTHGTA